MFDSNYYNEELLLNYDSGSLDLQQVQNEEMATLNILYKKIGLESLYGLTHLDVGTCTGRYLKWAFEKGCRSIYGIDRSTDSIHFCNENIRINAHLHCGCCSNNSSYESIEFIHSCTVMFGTISHLDELQIIDFLKILKDKMGSGSVIATSTWNKPPVNLGIYNDINANYLYDQSKNLNYSVFRLCGFNQIQIQNTKHLTIRLFIKQNNFGV